MQESLSEDFQSWQSLLAQNAVRGTILLCENEPFLLEFYQNSKLQQLNVIDSGALQTPHVGAQVMVDKFLGQEFDGLIFDARNSFDTNLFAALTGTLTAGGVLILRLPAMLATHLDALIKDSDRSDDILNTIECQNLSSCLKRFIRFANGHSTTALISSQHYRFQSFSTVADTSFQSAIEAQRSLINDICRVAKGHAKRPLVITANRGRGKSAALGLAAAKLMDSSPVKIIVTAPMLANLHSFYKHLGFPVNAKRKIEFTNGSILEFLPVDKILDEKPQAGLLMIDEAAAIPVQQLHQLTSQYNRIVFATTSHGYEGNGKGFEIRFKEKLLSKMPQTRFARLTNPMRWSNKDELEKICFETFLLDCELATVTDEENPSDYQFQLLSKQELSADENRLQQVFSLLVNAHYQTRPADLEQILDNNDLSVTVLLQKDQVLAVALVSQEGDLAPEVCQQLYDGQKRLKGHLLPQSIITNKGLGMIGEQSFYRVMRIAVHPHKQAQGLGSRLLAELHSMAKARQIDFLGASFAAESHVVRFWLKNQFNVIRFGGAKDSSSGAYSCEVLLALSPRSQDYFQNLIERFRESFFYKLQKELKDLDAPTIIDLIRFQINTAPTDNRHGQSTISPLERQELAAFATGSRGFASVDWSLTKLFISALFPGPSAIELESSERNFLVDMLIKQRDYQSIAAQYQYTGKKQILTALRNLTRKLLGPENSTIAS